MSNHNQQLTHYWCFVRTAGFDQVHLESSAEVMVVAESDQMRWAALRCPSSGIAFYA